MAKTIVHKNAPTKPSTVFFGESLMSGVRPMVIPQMYAKTSLQMTRDAGTKNQIRPSRMLFMMKWLRTALDKHPTALFTDSYLETTMSRSVICTQQNKPNCCLRWPFFSDITKPTKPIV